MKRLKLYLTAALCLAMLACACSPAETKEEEPETPVTPPEPPVTTELLKPRLSVSGLPSATILEGSAFNLNVSTKSNARVQIASSVAEPLVSIKAYGTSIYRITLGNPEADTPVTLTVSQEATPQYEAAAVEVSFTIKVKVEDTPPDVPGADPTLEGFRTVYEETMEDILNPERGFYSGAGDIRNTSGAVTVSKVKAARNSGKSIMYVGFYLTNYMNGDIAQDYLDMIDASLNAFREGGAKCILRFAYQNSENSKPWDAPVDVVLRHVEQLKPLLQKHADIIFVMQAGFVGVWGEWYYTTHFIMNPNKNSDYEPRRQLTDALLDALPENRQIQLRTPQFKMRMYGLSAADTLTAAMAHDGTPMSRLAGHNDCFGASSDDSGTFGNEKNDRDFWKAETRYTIMGGETCKESNYCLCEATLKDLEDYHWTYLNSGYNTSVINRWKTSGCYDEIVRRLGYRLVLLDSYRTENPTAGDKFDLALRIVNRGYAAPQNPRNAILVFVDGNGKKTEFELGSDPRTWHTGVHVIKTSFTLPAAKGTLYLNLSDPMLPDRPEYSIALANKNMFDSTTGLNKILELK